MMNPFPLGKAKAIIGFGNKANKNKSNDLFKDAADKFGSDETCRKCLATGVSPEMCRTIAVKSRIIHAQQNKKSFYRTYN